MKIYIVTPSYNQLDWLKLCVKSVADQATDGMEQGAGCIEVHHHVQDARSTDDTPEWLERYAQEISPSGIRSADSTGHGSQGAEEGFPNAQSLKPKASLSGYTFSYESAPDNGMYDAINRGWEKAPDDVDVIAHLNCDEQYLPGALQKIAECFVKHPKADVVFSDMIVVDSDGNYICHRRPLPPMPIHSRLFIPGFTCTTFQRRSVFFEKGCRFDTSWKNLGDVLWYLSLIKKKCRFQMVNEYTSIFADMESNLNLQESGRIERERYYQSFPGWVWVLYPVAFRIKQMRYAVRMFFSKTPQSYSIYLPGSKDRVRKPITHPTCVWEKRRAWRHAQVEASKKNRK